MDVKKWVTDRVKRISDWEKYRFEFGKYKGNFIWEVFEYDPQYFQWVFLNARNRLNPEVDIFIRSNHRQIASAIAEQEEAEKNMFHEIDWGETSPSSSSLETSLPASKPD